MGLSKDSMESLDAASRGAFLYLSTSETRAMLDRISGKTPYTNIHNELSEKEKKSSPDQEEEVLIANKCYRHGMMKTIFSPIDIHEETILE